VGVKVTAVPAQTVVADAAILTAGTTEGVMVIVTLFEVAVRGETQAALEVITQDTTSPLANVLLEYVDPVVVFTPFTFHW
jgi:hypothetical protein